MYKTLDPDKITWVWVTVTETEEEMIKMCHERGWKTTIQRLEALTPDKDRIFGFEQFRGDKNIYLSRNYWRRVSAFYALKDTYDESEFEEAKATAMHLYDAYLTRIKRELDLVAK